MQAMVRFDEDNGAKTAAEKLVKDGKFKVKDTALDAKVLEGDEETAQYRKQAELKAIRFQSEFSEMYKYFISIVLCVISFCCFSFSFLSQTIEATENVEVNIVNKDIEEAVSCLIHRIVSSWRMLACLIYFC